MTADALPSVTPAADDLPTRLAALSRLVEIASARRGADGFSDELLAEAQSLLERSDHRLRLSAEHTVVTLAGGTGSGKSSLFNALAGAPFSPVAVTRPATRDPHACVWGMAGAGPLLDWLGVQRRHRYARASALDAGEASLTGLLLLDLPDHDSVAAGPAATVDRLVTQADMMIWVLDPQKYADAAVHRRYLTRLARHAPVTTVVLNQCDRLTPEQARDCEADLRRLLDTEGLHAARLLLVSAATGAGLDELRMVLAEAVSQRRSATQRMAAAIDDLVERFACHAGAPDRTAHRVATPAAVPLGSPVVDMPPSVGFASAKANAAGVVAATDPAPRRDEEQGAVPDGDGQRATSPRTGPAPDGGRDAPTGRTPTADDTDGARVPAQLAADLTDALARAAGVPALTDALQSSRELHAARYIYWPPGRVIARLTGRDPARALRLATVADAARPVTAAPPDVNPATVDGAVTVFADRLAATLPDPWPRTVRAAARSRLDEIRAALNAAVTECLPAWDDLPRWWRPIGFVQWALAVMAVAGAAWICLVAVIGAGHAMRHPPSPLLGDVAVLPWLGAMVLALLLLGWVTAWGCESLVVLAADRERRRIGIELRSRVEAIARDLIVAPAERELGEYAAFVVALATVRRLLPVDGRRSATRGPILRPGGGADRGGGLSEERQHRRT